MANYAEAYSNFDRTNYTQSDYRAIVGESLGLIYGYEFDGIYQVDDFYTSAATGKLILKPGITNNTRYDGGAAPGVVKYKDQNGDGKITTADRTVIGNAMPKWFGGITNSFSFKGIDFSFMLQYSYGNVCSTQPVSLQPVHKTSATICWQKLPIVGVLPMHPTKYPQRKGM